MKDLKLFSIVKLILYGFCLSALVPAQEKTNTVVQKNISGNNVNIREFSEIPEATEPCEPIVCDWWNKLRQSGNELQRKGNDKSRKTFFRLLAEGLEKSYSVPLKDQSSKVLVPKRPEIGDIMKTRRVHGKIVLLIEYRADTSIGEIKVLESLGSYIDNRFVQAARQALFLPAIKDGFFVTEWQRAEVEIATDTRKPKN